MIEINGYVDRMKVDLKCCLKLKQSPEGSNYTQPWAKHMVEPNKISKHIWAIN